MREPSVKSLDAPWNWIHPKVTALRCREGRKQYPQQNYVDYFVCSCSLRRVIFRSYLFLFLIVFINRFGIVVADNRQRNVCHVNWWPSAGKQSIKKETISPRRWRTLITYKSNNGAHAVNRQLTCSKTQDW